MFRTKYIVLLKKAGFIAGWVSLSMAGYGRHLDADSMIHVLNTTKILKAKITTLCELTQFYDESDQAKAYKYGQRALELVQGSGDKVLHYKVYSAWGQYLFKTGKYDEAKIWFRKSLACLGNIKTVEKDRAITLSNYGLLLKRLSEFDSALICYQQSYKIREQLQDAEGRAGVVMLMGSLYFDRGDLKNAEKYYIECDKLCRESHSDAGTAAGALVGLGIIKGSNNDLKGARAYFEKALKVAQDAHDDNMTGTVYANLAFAAMLEGDNEKATELSAQTIRLKRKSADLDDMGSAMVDHAMFLMQLGDRKTAELYIDSALALGAQTNEKSLVAYASENGAFFYAKQGDFKKAYEMQLEYTRLFREMFDEKKEKQISEFQEMFETEKKEKQNKLLANQNQLNQLTIKRQRLMNIIWVVGFVVLLGGAVFIFINLRQKRKVNKLLNRQNQEITGQKAIIEEKNKEMLDSIHYAKRIQHALLTSEQYWNNISPEHFILFMPRDVVSGDFYWAYATQEDNRELAMWCAADCTGHGVPGAFMSMLGIGFLNEIVVENKTVEPDRVLNHLRERIIRALDQQSKNEEQKDGMDISFCAWDKSNNKLHFSGANNPVWIVRNKEVIEIKGDKMPVGKFVNDDRPFSTRSVDLQKNDIIYSFSDGYADQFGGPGGKKFRYAQLRELLLSISILPLHEQLHKLKDAFAAWKGELEQLDDVCVIGVKVV